MIEREVVTGSPVDYDYSASMVMQEPDGPEHYDLENASSIAPSDIDVIYHYKGYREGGGRMERWGRGQDDDLESLRTGDDDVERSDELGLSEAGLDVSGEDVLEDETEITQSTVRSLSLTLQRI